MLDRFCMIVFGLFFIIFCEKAESENLNSSFGNTLTINKSMELKQVLKNFKDYRSKNVLIEGVVKKVCLKKGCWMVVSSGKNQMRVTFKDYGFFVPNHILNKKVAVEGIIHRKWESEGETRHFMEDEGALKKDILKIKGGRAVYHFVASGVKVI